MKLEANNIPFERNHHGGAVPHLSTRGHRGHALQQLPKLCLELRNHITPASNPEESPKYSLKKEEKVQEKGVI